MLANENTPTNPMPGNRSTPSTGTDTSLLKAPSTPLWAVRNATEAVRGKIEDDRRHTSLAPQDAKKWDGAGIFSETRYVKSWVEVAPLLADLYSKENNSIRVHFPCGDTEPKEIRREQGQIRAFLRKYHGQPLEKITEALVEKLESETSSFSDFRSKHEGISAREWVEHNLKAPAVKVEGRSLAIADIVSIRTVSEAAEKLKQGDLVASLSDKSTKGIPVIFESPLGDDKDRTALACIMAAYKSTWSGKESFVWLIPHDDFDKRQPLALLGQERGQTLACSLDEFIARHMNPTAAQPSEASAPRETSEPTRHTESPEVVEWKKRLEEQRKAAKAENEAKQAQIEEMEAEIKKLEQQEADRSKTSAAQADEVALEEFSDFNEPLILSTCVTVVEKKREDGWLQKVGSYLKPKRWFGGRQNSATV